MNNLESTEMTVQERSMMDTATSRAAQEVQAAMVIAKKFPRDETAAFNRIMKACQRPGLAEVACYAYPRGGQTITGPSIRLAEALKMNWGNVDSGIIELEQKAGESIVMSYAWDLETNSKEVKIFTVKHERHTRTSVTALKDPRDIYELVANQGARRLRACILSVIPGDIVDAAVAKCEETLKGDGKEPLADRARKMVTAFDALGVSQPMIETRLGHKVDAMIEQELVTLRKIYTSIKDGAAKREDFFQFQNEPSGKSTAIGRVEKPAEKPAGATTGDTQQSEPASTGAPAGLLASILNQAKALDVGEKKLTKVLIEKRLMEPSEKLDKLDDTKLGRIIDAWEDIAEALTAK